MRLKRGAERESCDFCHGRKIKCDRALRVASGIDACSACERRELACLVDDSSDIRLQRRRLNSRSTLPQTAEHSSLSTALPSPVTAAGQTPAIVTAASTTAIPYTTQEPHEEALFDLNAESAFFLDQIFMGTLASEWPNDTYTGLAMDMPVPTTSAPRSEMPSDIDHYRELWQDCAMPADLFRLAVWGYFDHAALALPITFEDAFWHDVHATVASAAFVCAIACRGMPFTRHRDKWSLQRRLALKFKELFLQRQQDDDTKSTPSLDDVEALALMVDFPYGEADVSGLERLFLSKKSLVLMALQMGPATGTGGTSFSRAPERHSLLFWHVYGLDAFSCLDAKTPSRIPEAEARLHITDTGSGYLDAVLSLALVARAILQRLSDSARAGVTYADVDGLYKQLENWRDVSCPPHLRSWRADGEAAQQYLPVQRAVLHLLRVNCYLQIENWVEEHGLGVTMVADQMTAARVEYESLRAVKDGADMAEWLGDCHVGDFAVIDLAPNILRDINAGLGVWTCLHGMQQLGKSIYRLHDQSTKSLLEMHFETASLFRSTVATAVSHSDTTTVLARVDEQMVSLKSSMEIV